MFAYCLNNPINAIDPGGKDAIWLQDTYNQVAKIFGHTGLLLQNEEGTWYYFNWTNGSCSFVEVEKETYDYTSLDSMMKIDGDRYDVAIYFEGDFSESINYAQRQKDTYNTEKYALGWNNCMQVVADVLMEGKFNQSDYWYKASLCEARNSIVPNLAFSKMLATDTKIQVLHAAYKHICVWHDSR